MLILGCPGWYVTTTGISLLSVRCGGVNASPLDLDLAFRICSFTTLSRYALGTKYLVISSVLFLKASSVEHIRLGAWVYGILCYTFLDDMRLKTDIDLYLLASCKGQSCPLRFGSENQFPLNFSHEYILVQK